MAKSPTTLDEILERCWVDPQTGCAIWIGAQSNGSGRIFTPGVLRHLVSKRQITAPLAAWLLAGRQLPGPGEALVRLPECKDQLCINPDHRMLAIQGVSQRMASARGSFQSEAFKDGIIRRSATRAHPIALVEAAERMLAKDVAEVLGIGKTSMVRIKAQQHPTQLRAKGAPGARLDPLSSVFALASSIGRLAK